MSSPPIRKISASYTDWIREKFPSFLSDKLGCYPGYEHTITMSNDAQPIIRKMQPMPIARHDGVAKEVQVLMDDDIWELVERSRLQLQLVTVPKSDGSPRITADLSPLNQHMVPVRYPLPVIKDLFLELWGAHAV